MNTWFRDEARGGGGMLRIRFLAFFLGIVFGFAYGGLAHAADFFGEWSGSWSSNGGGGGDLSAVISQSGTSLSGTLTIRGTDCTGHRDFEGLELTGTVTGDTASFDVSATCPSDNSFNELRYTNATLSGNTMSGDYEVYSDGEFWDSGTFTLTRKTYTITASVGTGGSISPSGSLSVNSLADQTFTITPDQCYEISDVLVDGSSVGPKASHTFQDVVSNHTIHATFALKGYTIVATAWLGGTISPSGSISVDCAADESFTITANPGYRILDVLVDDSSIGAVSSYSFENVQDDHTIVASFELDGSTCEVLRTEGFEGAVMPPSGWTLIKTNTDKSWIVTNTFQHTGTYSAGVSWDDVSQDEVLLTPVLRMASGTLRFWSMGSLLWCRDTQDNCDLEIWLVVNSWDGGANDDIFVGKADDDWLANFEWALTEFDLTQKVPGKPVRIGFRYKGLNGDSIVIDDVQVCYDRANTFIPGIPLLLFDQ
jgi:hypothetical protein